MKNLGAATGLPSRAIAEGATTPNPGYQALIWSSSANKVLVWNGTAWAAVPQGADLSGFTAAATSKATPVDADQLPLVDSTASNGLKKLTWANLKSTLKTYFDALYQAASANLTTWAGKTVPSGTVVGTTDTQTLTNKTIKLDSAGSIYSQPSTGSVTTAARTVSMLAEFKSASSATTGAVVFIAPNTLSSIMHRLHVQGMLYNDSIVDFVIQGYRTTGAWSATRKVDNGSESVQTRFGLTPDGRNCLIIGDVASVWAYPHFAITEAMFSHGSVADSYCTGWEVALVTDLSTYTNVTSNIGTNTQATGITGNAATATKLATARTINGTAFDGTANIDIPSAKGGGTDKVFFINDQTVTTDFTISATQNAGSFGDITINAGVNVTIQDGGSWTMV